MSIAILAKFLSKWASHRPITSNGEAPPQAFQPLLPAKMPNGKDLAYCLIGKLIYPNRRHAVGEFIALIMKI